MRRTVIPQTDLEVSALCYGTAGLGSAIRGDDVDALLGAFREEGGNFVDTAHCYAFWTPQGDGCSERAIADYVRRNGKGDLVICTKGGHPGWPPYRKTESWLAPYRVQADIDDSLGRLDLEAIDLYLLHRDDTRWTVEEVVEMLNAEVRRGRIRHIGASNWTFGRLEAANLYAERKGLQGFVLSQIEWSLAHKEPPEPLPHGAQTVYAGPEELAFHERTGLPAMAFTATARGYFAPGTEKRPDFDNPTSQARLARARSLASELGATANQVALAWLTSHDFPVFPITGTGKVEHLREAAAATDLTLTRAQVAWLATGR
jgi:aryl-alcohol dehydrogenase-like predicted oxidoreductase